MADLLFDRGEFADRVALVTGGTDGLGEHLVRTLAALGCHVWFCARGVERGRTLAAELGDRARFVPTDLADPAAARAFVDQVGAHHGRLDYLVNNAAVDPRIPFETATLEQFDQLVAINLRAAFVVAQAALPWLRLGAGKAIVNTGTTNYLMGKLRMTVYGAAKAGLYGFTRNLARELGPEGIRVNLVAPGWIMTRRQLAEHVGPGDEERLLEHQCVKELLGPEHVTPVTLFLLSRAARGMSGQQVVVDGGNWLW